MGVCAAVLLWEGVLFLRKMTLVPNLSGATILVHKDIHGAVFVELTLVMVSHA
jgi:ribosomal protein S19